MEKGQSVTAEDQIKRDYVEQWHHRQKDMNFKLSDLDGETSDCYGNKDHNNMVLSNGMIRHFVDYDGKVRKGKIYHNINNMWWVIITPYVRHNIGSGSIFNDTFARRIRHLIPIVKVTVRQRGAFR